jgi:putative flippase GtrA
MTRSSSRHRARSLKNIESRTGVLPKGRTSRTLGQVSGRQPSTRARRTSAPAEAAGAPNSARHAAHGTASEQDKTSAPNTLNVPAQNGGSSHSVDSASAAAEVAHAAAAEACASTGGLRGQFMALHGRFSRLIGELGKFGTVGGIAFVVDAVIFNVLRVAHVERLLSATISMAVAATLAFVGNRFWTWRDRERSGLRREYTLYFLFNLGGLLIALAVLGISAYGLGSIWPIFTTPLADNVAKLGVGTVLGTLFRFWAYRNIVFRTVE